MVQACCDRLDRLLGEFRWVEWLVAQFAWDVPVDMDLVPLDDGFIGVVGLWEESRVCANVLLSQIFYLDLFALLAYLEIVCVSAAFAARKAAADFSTEGFH